MFRHFVAVSRCAVSVPAPVCAVHSAEKSMFVTKLTMARCSFEACSGVLGSVAENFVLCA